MSNTETLIYILQHQICDGLRTRISCVMDTEQINESLGHKHVLGEWLPESILRQFYSVSSDSKNTLEPELKLEKLHIHYVGYLIRALPELEHHFNPKELGALQIITRDLVTKYFVQYLVEIEDASSEPEMNGVSLEESNGTSAEDETVEKLCETAEILGFNSKDIKDTVKNCHCVGEEVITEFTEPLSKDVVFLCEAFKYGIDTLNTAEANKMRDSIKKLNDEVAKLQKELSPFKFHRDMIKTELQRVLKCPVCNSRLKNPKTLPCLHSFCTVCLKKQYNAQNKYVQCITCDLKVTMALESDLDKLKSSPVVQSYMACLELCTGNAANTNCKMCICAPRKLCLTCKAVFCNFHSMTFYHGIDDQKVDIDEILLEPTNLKNYLYAYCSLHGELLTKFCDSCKIPICNVSECVEWHVQHQQTPLRTIKETVESEQIQLNRLAKDLGKKLDKFRSKILASEQNQIVVADLQRNVLESVEKYFDDAEKQLNEKKNSFLKSVETIGTQCLAQDENVIESITEWTRDASSIQEAFDKQMSNLANGSSNLSISEILATKQQLVHSINDCVAGAALGQPGSISYPEGKLRSLLQYLNNLKPEITLMTLVRGWEAVVRAPGLRCFSISGNNLFIVKRSVLSGTPLLKYRLDDMSVEATKLNKAFGDHVSTGFQSYADVSIGAASPWFQSMDISSNGHVVAVGEVQNSLELPNMKIRREFSLYFYSQSTQLKLNTVVISQMNKPANPITIKCDRDKIYLSDGSSICEFSETGQLLRKFNFHSMVDIADFFPDSQQDYLYVTDRRVHCLMIFNSAQHVISRFGTEGAMPGDFNIPTGIVRDIHGHIIVADSGNCRIQVFDRTGKFLRIFPYPDSIVNTNQSFIATSPNDRSIIRCIGDYIYMFDFRSEMLWRLNYM